LGLPFGRALPIALGFLHAKPEAVGWISAFPSASIFWETESFFPFSFPQAVLLFLGFSETIFWLGNPVWVHGLGKSGGF
jgi:hypothetical protein